MKKKLQQTALISFLPVHQCRWKTLKFCMMILKQMSSFYEMFINAPQRKQVLFLTKDEKFIVTVDIECFHPQ